MLLLELVLAALLQQTAPQKPPWDGAIHMGGHAYRLSCYMAGDPVPCVRCHACELAVDHFEIRDEAGHIQFEKDAPQGKPFTNVLAMGFGNLGDQVLKIDTVQDPSPDGTPIARVLYAFEPTPSGLEPFNPPLTCLNGAMGDLASHTIALGCHFDTGYFTFTVVLLYDFSHHQITLMPDQKVFSVLFPRPYERLKATASAKLELYSDHEDNAPLSILAISPEDSTKLVAAWSPVSMAPVDGGPAGFQGVRHDASQVWLQVRVKGRTGWVRGKRSFEAIGLQIQDADR